MSIKYKELKGPVSVQIEITPRCNHKCIYCYNAWRKNDCFGTEITLNQYLDIARKLVESEVFEVVLTGGEPLIKRDVLYPLADFLSLNGVDVKLNTNLVLIDESDCRRIKDNGIRSVLGSLPSSHKETFNFITQTKNFENAVKGIERLVKYEMPPAINMVVVQENKDQVYDTGKFAYELGAKGFCGTPASPCEFLNSNSELKPTEIIKTLDDLLKLKADFGIPVDIVEPLPRCLFTNPKKYNLFLKKDCAAGKLTVAISSSGEVRPCTHVPISYGNLLNEDLNSIWKKMSEWRDGSFTPNRCSSCIEEIACSKGCREAAKLRNGRYTDEDPLIVDLKTPREFREATEEPRFDKNSKYSFKDIVIRSEEEGSLLFCKSSYTMGIVNSEFLSFIKNLKSREPFSFNELLNEQGQNSKEELERIFRFLVQRDFIFEK